MPAPGPATALAERHAPGQRRKRPTGPKAVLIVAFLVCGIPSRCLWYRWRTTVYRMHRWRINILPRFPHAFAALCTDRYFTRKRKHPMVRRYKPYLREYLGLLGWIPWPA